ncbi:uncharacterized protein [Cicer arietinum]|uniref:Uncharacterized protein LOC101513070 n=1 Tax=Cicer arietinum TaxID=3827 RepID=A0A1S2YDE5_CICAR|nr:uncharacterized protein LOC101513070 [Cicer arietinum]
MICSTKSGSNWLDRLRFNKGIPTDDDLDLDSFLLRIAAHSHSPHTRPIHPTNNPVRKCPTVTHDPPLSALLAELFNPGTNLTLISKKCPRKQTNPKIFLASSATTSSHAPAGGDADAAVVVEDRGEEGDEGDEDLKGFTRSEVTVIDTSCPAWKVDKFLFRKNSVWKIRERKPKNKFFAKKKSKTSHEIDIHGIGTTKDNVVNIGGEKPVKKLKVI